MSKLRDDLLDAAAHEQGKIKVLRRTVGFAMYGARWRELLDIRIRFHRERQAMFLTAANAVVGLAPE